MATPSLHSTPRACKRQRSSEQLTQFPPPVTGPSTPEGHCVGFSRAERVAAGLTAPASSSSTSAPPCSQDIQYSRDALAAPSLLSLPEELLLRHILPMLDARSLVALGATAKFFYSKDRPTQLPVTEAVAREAVLALYDGDLSAAERFEHSSWVHRLHIEEVQTGFNMPLCEAAGFCFEDDRQRGVPVVRLSVMGPKLLTSDLSTADTPLLHWRLRIRGNTAVEFGAVPVTVESNVIALHKCVPTARGGRERAVGICSQITAGSALPFKVSMMRDTAVDVLLRRGRIEFVVCNPEGGQDLYWVNGQPKPREYYGPPLMSMQHALPTTTDFKLAVTAWAKGSFDILHHAKHPIRPSRRNMGTQTDGAAAGTAGRRGRQ